MRRSWPLLSLFFLAVACTPAADDDAGLPDAGSSDDGGSADGGDDGGSGSVDGGGADGGEVDAGAPDAGGDDEDGGAPNDGGTNDAGSVDGGDSDGGDDDAGDVDAGPDGIDVEAVLGARCEPSTRIGLVELKSWGGDTFWALAELYDRPRPWFGPASESTDMCAFYEGAAGCECADNEVCAFGGGCAEPPLPWSGLALRVVGADGEQLIDEGWLPGSVEGEVTVAGPSLAVELLADGVSVRAASMPLPPELTGAVGALEGGSMSPTGLELSWTPTADGFDVFTHVAMNHHVSVPAFTECRVDGSTGEMSIPGSMLAPLALVTGLEFQGLETARFAAATTERGCIEIRFSRMAFVFVE